MQGPVSPAVGMAIALPTADSSLLGVRASVCALFVSKVAVPVGFRRVFFGFVVLANCVMVGRLMVMMRGGMVITGRSQVMLM